MTNVTLILIDNETDVINGDSVCGRGRTFGPVTLTGSSLVVVFVSKTSRFSFSTKQGFRLLFLSAADLSSTSTTNYLCSENNFSFGNIRGRDFVVSFSSDDSENRHGFLIRYKSTASSKKGDCTQSTADIVFLLDSSGSVGETNFVFLTSFISDLVYDFNVGPDVVQVGMVTFESNVTNHFNLNQYATKEEVINATHQLPYSGGRTLTDLGLNHTLWHSFTEENGARSHATRVLLVFTDGASNRPSSTRAVAEEVKQAGITIISVGVESGVDPTELFAIASHEEYVFQATSFTDLETIKYSLESIICKIITSAPSSLTLTTTTRSSSLHPPTLQAPILSPSIPVLAPQVSSTDTQSSTVGGNDTTTSITSSDVSSSSPSSDVSSSDIAPTGTGSTVEMTSSSPDGVSTSVLSSSSSRVSLTSRTTQQHISSESVSTTTIQSDINSKSNQSSNLPDVKGTCHKCDKPSR
uniref:Collagen alpha-1(XII) chain n=1 Tax=Magallana gigas TaxID=29159 RepID=K1QNT5_MAGGI